MIKALKDKTQVWNVHWKIFSFVSDHERRREKEREKGVRGRGGEKKKKWKRVRKCAFSVGEKKNRKKQRKKAEFLNYESSSMLRSLQPDTPSLEHFSSWMLSEKQEKNCFQASFDKKHSIFPILIIFPSLSMFFFLICFEWKKNSLKPGKTWWKIKVLIWS